MTMNDDNSSLVVLPTAASSPSFATKTKFLVVCFFLLLLFRLSAAAGGAAAVAAGEDADVEEEGHSYEALVSSFTSANNETTTITITDDDPYNGWYDNYPTPPARVQAYLPKPFALLSMICSYVMIREVATDQRSNCGTPITRTLLSMAIADVFFSFAWLLGTIPSPSSLEWLEGNLGSQQFCTFQGFIWAIGYMTGSIFNAALSIMYLLIVRYNWTDAQLRKLEPWVQGSIWTFSFAVALYPIPLEMYNNNFEVCAVEPIPHDCRPGHCKRGANARAHQSVFTVTPWLCLFISVVAMSLLFCTVISIENKSRKYASTIAPSAGAGQQQQGQSWLLIIARVRQCMKQRSENRGSSDGESTDADAADDETEHNNNDTGAEEQRYHVNRRKSTAVAVQGICYALAFLMTYLLDLVQTLWWYAAARWHIVLRSFAYGMMLPSAGTFNVLVFARRRTSMKTREGRWLRFLVCCSCCRKGDGGGATRTPNNESRTTVNPGEIVSRPKNARNIPSSGGLDDDERIEEEDLSDDATTEGATGCTATNGGSTASTSLVV